MVTVRQLISKYYGLSTDEKPINVQNGCEFKEIDTGDVYMFDEEHVGWLCFSGGDSEDTEPDKPDIIN